MPYEHCCDAYLGLIAQEHLPAEEVNEPLTVAYRDAFNMVT